MITDEQIKEFMGILDNFVDNNFIIEDLCEICGDSAYIEPNNYNVDAIKYKKNINEFLGQIKNILKLNTLKGFLNG